MTSQTKLEEGGVCPNCDGKGILGYNETIDCYCHISPPCGNCLDKQLTCDFCGVEYEQD